MINEIFSGLTALGALATAGAFWLGLQQVRAAENEIEQTKQHAQTSFEDDLSREYREIVHALPVAAFYEDGDIEFDDELRRTFYRYFDLCNEQLFLSRLDRVSTDTTAQWRAGIVGNLRLPVFLDAWRDISPHIRADFFVELRDVITAERLLDGATETTERKLAPGAAVADVPTCGAKSRLRQ
jgi:hypothetical protein